MEPDPRSSQTRKNAKLKKQVSKVLKRLRRRWYTLQSHSDAVQAKAIRVVQVLCSAQQNHYPAPHFVGMPGATTQDRQNCRSWPELHLFCILDATVIGNCNFILHQGKAIHPDLYLPERDKSPLELYGKAVMDKNFKRIRIPKGLSLGSLPCAINLCDQTPYNYAHWMTEVLPKLTYISSLPDLASAPILVDLGISEPMIESIHTIAGKNRKIIQIQQYEQIQVQKLFSISPTSYCPHDFRDFFKAQASDFQFFFSHEAILGLRTHLRHRYKQYADGRPRSVYLKRTLLWTYNKRCITNLDDIEDLLDQYQFETINVSGMSLAHQARIFMNAEVIVAPTGAALINMIFAAPGCRIIVMAARYTGATYDYFHILAQILGHHLIFVTGPQDAHEQGHHMNRAFSINGDDLHMALAHHGVKPYSTDKTGVLVA
jgi:capsular polysaccharide biosynthesis protein